MTDTNFQMLDTGKLQAESLMRLMDALGYKPEETVNGRVRFTTENPQLKGTRKLAFSTAVRLHNMGVEGWEEFYPGVFRVKDSELDLAITAFDLVGAYAKRLVLSCKYQQNKRAPRGVQLTGNMVKVASPLFINALGL